MRKNLKLKHTQLSVIYHHIVSIKTVRASVCTDISKSIDFSYHPEQVNKYTHILMSCPGGSKNHLSVLYVNLGIVLILWAKKTNTHTK